MVTGSGFRRKTLWVAAVAAILIALWSFADWLERPLRLEMEFVRQFGGYGDGPGQFLEVSDIAVDGLDRVLVADLTRADVQVFSTRGEHLLTVGGRDSAESCGGCSAVS